jgi:hypothetical protein
LAGALVDGAWGPVLERCESDEALAALVSRAAADILTARATSHLAALPPEEAAWPAAQECFLRLALVQGIETRYLASALFDACIFEPVSGTGTDLWQETMHWFLKSIPNRVARLVDEADDPDIHPRFLAPVPWGLRKRKGRFVFNALFGLRGQEGVDWLLRMQARDDSWVGSAFQAMCSGQLPVWEPEDWIMRVDALADTRLEPRPRLVQVFVMAKPPPVSAVAQVRLACVYANAPTDQLLRAIAGNIRSYLTGDAEVDAAMFWWDASPRQRPLLRWILELSGPAGFREQAVLAAGAAGWIDRHAQLDLASALERPTWADKEVPWEFVEILDAGTVRLPDGRLAGGDPWWSFEGLPFEIELVPGSYAVRVMVAAHPLRGRENAAAELIIDSAAKVARWEIVETGPDREGYCTEVGAASFGAADTLCPGLGEDLPRGLFRKHPQFAEVDGGEAGSLVMFTVGPQHQNCRTWAGLAPDGRIARLLTDLGLLGLDPTSKPLPWCSATE